MMHKLLKHTCRQMLLTSFCLHARRLGTHTHRISSYNVLSSHLADPSYFTNCTPEYLAEGYRYDLLLKKMDKEVDKNAIICLQEVSADWAGKLHTYFAQRNYHFVTALYGNKFDGYMGVGMAFSHQHYDLNNADIKRVVDTKQNAPQPIFQQRRATTSPSIVTRFRSIINRWLPSQAPPGPVGTSAPLSSSKLWSEVMRRKNEMISLKLTCKTSSDCFYVGTYHMPCVFRVPEVMVVHAALAAQHLHHLASQDSSADSDSIRDGNTNTRFKDTADVDALSSSSLSSSGETSTLAELVAASSVDQPPSRTLHAASQTVLPRSGRVLPYILAGDFNIKPESSVYHLLTQGSLPPTSPERIEPSKPGDTWTAHTHPLRSAYMQANDMEPDFTNHAQIRDEEPFIDTLDYVFLSPTWRVAAVDELPHRDTVTGPFPTATEGSDHVLIAANVVLQKDDLMTKDST